MYFKSRFYSQQLGRFLSRDPLGTDSTGQGPNLYVYAVSDPTHNVDPSGLKAALCGATPYDDEEQCCTVYTNPCGLSGGFGTLVNKVIVYVINRSGGGRTGTMEGHIDLGVPGSGMVGFYGIPGGGGAFAGSGMGLTGHLNQTPDDWNDGPTKRPDYITGVAGGVLSTICEIKVCPEDVAKMNDEIKKLKAKPPTFNILGGNCSTRGCGILGAGGVMPGGIPGLDNPQNLLDELVKKYHAKCYNGFTKLNPDGSVSTTPTGPAPGPAPPGSSD
jgi:hypothetical protein